MASLRSLIARAPGGARRAGRISGIAALAAAALVPAGLGCTSLNKTKSEFAQALHLEPPKPASQIICFWQRRPAYLPDPGRDGVMAPGLVGQMFLISQDNKSVDITGDLVVQATDETHRPAGQAPAVTEVWHFDKATLKKLATKDERFGTCYALFLPWPSNWKDVTNVRMQAKYISKPSPDLVASEVTMTLEFTTPGAAAWNDVNKGGKPTGPAEMKGIPDLAKVFKAQPTGAFPPAGAEPTPALALAVANPIAPRAPAGVFMPPAQPGPAGAPGQYTTPGPDGTLVTTKTWTSPAPTVIAPPPPPAAFAGTVVPTVPTVSPPPIQLVDFGPPPMPANFGQARPQPTAPPPPALPPALPDDPSRSWGTPPGPNGGLPPIALPAPPGSGALHPVVIPRF